MSDWFLFAFLIPDLDPSGPLVWTEQQDGWPGEGGKGLILRETGCMRHYIEPLCGAAVGAPGTSSCCFRCPHSEVEK